jgi:serine/threonine protein kinase
MSLQPGARLGPYEILSTVGAGGMGEVYRCRDARVPRTIVALKVLAAHVAEDADFRMRFSREAQIIARLDHPHIGALYDVGEDNGTPFIVMPLLEGQSLADRLREGAIPPGEALRIVTAVASALAYAHERGVLHRDVKPRNIMLGADGSVKLVDFGIARSIAPASDPDATIDSLTTADRLVGTLEYMSPEQLAGGAIDGRSDLFSLGVVFYEMVAGRHPFRAESRMTTACAILECRYPPISSTDPFIQAIDALLAQTLSLEPAQRDASMTDLLKELEFLRRFLVPGRTNPDPLIWGWSHRAIGVAFAGAAVMVMLVIALTNGLNGRAVSATPSDSVPVSSSAAASSSDPGRSIVDARKRGSSAGGAPVAYQQVDSAVSTNVAGDVTELGVTVWRLRRSTSQDAVRLLEHRPGTEADEWTPERISLGTPLASGDRVRISVESPREGYLYVIDRERYADGSTGTPQVIFPTLHTRDGDNRLAAGRLIDIPSQADRPPYFTLTSRRSDHTAELLTLFVSTTPLQELSPGEQPIKLTPDLLKRLEQRGSSQVVQLLELSGGAGRAWSAEEQLAAADATRVLTQSAPPPQTVFRIVTSEPGFLVAEVMLAHMRRK